MNVDRNTNFREKSNSRETGVATIQMLLMSLQKNVMRGTHSKFDLNKQKFVDHWVLQSKCFVFIITEIILPLEIKPHGNYDLVF